MQKDHIIVHTPQLNLKIVLSMFEHDVWKLKNVTYLWSIYVMLFEIKMGGTNILVQSHVMRDGISGECAR